MDFARQQLAIVQERLAALSASQKMLTAALAVILVMTMLYWGKISASPDRVPVSASALAGEDLAAVTTALRATGIEYTLDGGKVMVAADKQVDALGAISQALPANSNAFDTMFEKLSPWDAQGVFDLRAVNAKQQYMNAIISKWPGVKKADVMITDAPNSALSRREPRMAISIQTRGGDADRRKIGKLARNLAMGAVAGLSEKFITVNVDMTTVNGDAGDVANGGDMLEQISNFEASRADQIRNSLLIPGALVEVTADMETSTKTMSQHSVDGKNKFSEVDSSEHETSTPVSVAPPAAEPGVVANTNVAISTQAGPSGGSGVATDKLNEKSMVDYGRTDTTTSTLAGACRIVGATVRIPHSYFASIWKSAHPKQTDGPSDEELKAFVMDELAGIRSTVTALTKLKSPDDITVRDYYEPIDLAVGGPMLATASTGVAGNLTLLATGHARELAIGVLAVTSLFMVSRMVKKAAPSPLMLAGAGGLNMMVADDDDEVPAVAKRKASPKVIGGEEVLAEVGDGGGIMFGQEIDPDVLETSQMIEQVAGFVKDNPEAAAQMIGRWMSHD